MERPLHEKIIQLFKYLGCLKKIYDKIKIIDPYSKECINAKEKTLCDNIPDNQQNIEGITDNLILRQNIKYRKKKKTNICRFCLCEDNEADNPLINACKCSGTMKYIHIDCLKNWLKSKILSKRDSISLYY